MNIYLEVFVRLPLLSSLVELPDVFGWCWFNANRSGSFIFMKRCYETEHYYEVSWVRGSRDPMAFKVFHSSKIAAEKMKEDLRLQRDAFQIRLTPVPVKSIYLNGKFYF